MDVACSDGVCIGRYERDWRWHKKLQQWMMKAKEFGDPQQLPSQREERGYYYFFDVNNWRRDRVSGMVVRPRNGTLADACAMQKEFILNYDHLHHIPTATRPMAMYQ